MEKKTPPRPEPALKAAERRACDAVQPAGRLVVASIQALHAGTATPQQQKAAIAWIVREAGGKAYFPYHTDPRDTAFALGRYFVADCIVGLINADLSSLRRADHVEIASRSS